MHVADPSSRQKRHLAKIANPAALAVSSRSWPPGVLGALFWILCLVPVAGAHPLIENGLDVVIGRDQIIVTAKISPEEIALVEGSDAATQPADARESIYQRHAQYVAKCLRVQSDGVEVPPLSHEYVRPAPDESTALIRYRLRYAVADPKIVRLEQSFLREHEGWSATCILRIRQADESKFSTSLLTSQQTAKYGCDWSQPAPATVPTTNAVAGSDESTADRQKDSGLESNARISRARQIPLIAWIGSAGIILVLGYLFARAKNTGK